MAFLFEYMAIMKTLQACISTSTDWTQQTFTGHMIYVHDTLIQNSSVKYTP